MSAEARPDGPCGRVQAIRDSLPAGMVWDEREAALLAFAGELARNVEALERDIAEQGVRRDDRRLNGSLAEHRQQVVALSRVLGQLDIPDSEKPASVHARRAAQARWSAG